MNAKVIFALSALFACACAQDFPDLALSLWDEAGGKLKFSVILTLAKVGDNFHAEVKNAKIITNEGATPESVAPYYTWVLTNAQESISADFSFNPAAGTASVTPSAGASASAQAFIKFIIESLAQGLGIEHFYAKGEELPTLPAESFFGTCAKKNVNKVNKGADVILSFDIDHANCSKRNPIAASPAASDNENHRFVFQDGKKLIESSLSGDYALNGVTHHIGGKITYA